VSLFRVVAQIDLNGKFRFTKTNAYSGNNGRAVILINTNGVKNGIIVAAGAQILTAETKALVVQNLSLPVGSFNITQVFGGSPDKIGKDTNFRGLTNFNKVVYYTKGSGRNGINSSAIASAGMRFRTSATISSTGTDATQRCLPRTPGDETTTIGVPSASVFPITSHIDGTVCAAHFRENFPKRLDETWMKHTLAWADNAATKVRVDYRPVHTKTLTDDVQYFPPQEQIR
jgi:hypothetical protein